MPHCGRRLEPVAVSRDQKDQARACSSGRQGCRHCEQGVPCAGLGGDDGRPGEWRLQRRPADSREATHRSIPKKKGKPRASPVYGASKSTSFRQYSRPLASQRRQIGGDLADLLRGQVLRVLVHDFVGPRHGREGFQLAREIGLVLPGQPRDRPVAFSFLAVAAHTGRHAFGGNAVSKYRFAGSCFWRGAGLAGHRGLGGIIGGDGLDGYDKQNGSSWRLSVAAHCAERSDSLPGKGSPKASTLTISNSY
jgi:hypothetical protein